jgi:uncharacterized protein involved in exopolysaccharide biosynthesis
VSPAARQDDVESDDADLLDYARVIWRHRWLILVLCLVSVLGTLIYMLYAPKIYESTTTLLLPKEGAGSGLLSALAASGLAQQLPGISLPSLTPNRDAVVSILKSRTVGEAVVQKFGLQERYKVPFLQDAIGRLHALTKVSVSKEGVIAVKVEETDPQLAAQIANFFIEQLDRLVLQFGSGEASHQRKFIGEQLALARRNLESAEDALRRFQERNKAIVLQEQTRGAIEAAARLKGEMMASEVQLQVMRSFATESNPEVISLRHRVDEMKRQLAQMQYGDEVGRSSTGGVLGGARQEIYVPFAKVPEVGLELARQTRELKVQETLVSLLAQQLEQAKIAEAKDMPNVQVLDRAVPAERHSRPRVRLSMLIAGAISLFTGMFVALILEHVQGASSRRRRR